MKLFFDLCGYRVRHKFSLRSEYIFLFVFSIFNEKNIMHTCISMSYNEGLQFTVVILLFLKVLSSLKIDITISKQCELF